MLAGYCNNKADIIDYDDFCGEYSDEEYDA